MFFFINSNLKELHEKAFQNNRVEFKDDLQEFSRVIYLLIING